MRTAISLAVLRKTGETVIIAGQNVPLHLQRQKFKKAFAGLNSHPEFAEAAVWESSTGRILWRKFRTPEEEARRVAAHVETLEKLDGEQPEEQAPQEPEPDAPTAPEPPPAPADPQEPKPEPAKAKRAR